MDTVRDTGVEPAAFGSGDSRGRFAPIYTGFQPSQSTTIVTQTEEPNLQAAHAFTPVLNNVATRLLPPTPDHQSVSLNTAVLSADPLLTVRQLAMLFQVSTATIYRMVDRGELKCVRVSNSMRFSRAEIKRFMQRQPGPWPPHENQRSEHFVP